MAWTSFKLGRPGHELTFDVNPSALRIDDRPVKVMQENAAGDSYKSVLRTSKPSLSILSNFLTKTQRDQIASMAGITDTFLSFLTRDDWQVVAQRLIPSDTTHVTLAKNSATRLDAILVAGGFTANLSGWHVYDNPDGTGTDYAAGGSYAAATRVLTLGTPLPSAANPCYATYTYRGWLVEPGSLQHSGHGGWVDRFDYSFDFQGV